VDFLINELRQARCLPPRVPSAGGPPSLTVFQRISRGTWVWLVVAGGVEQQGREGNEAIGSDPEDGEVVSANFFIRL